MDMQSPGPVIVAGLFVFGFALVLQGLLVVLPNIHAVHLGTLHLVRLLSSIPCSAMFCKTLNEM